MVLKVIGSLVRGIGRVVGGLLSLLVDSPRIQRAIEQMIAGASWMDGGRRELGTVARRAIEAPPARMTEVAREECDES